ncbi:MAG: low molecular weight protein arginine phosphatase [Promethearchaeota archaeon]|nr:MAG: low molecular weight protein arginine phosphatase [Candidatus Lokiarchaeota archaeon]
MVIMDQIKNILFVCSGNTARSPAAEYLAKHYARKYEIKLHFDSAGFFNAFSYMQPESRTYLDKKGINHSDFSPKTLNKSLLKKQDLIITMTQRHVNQIFSEYDEIPEVKERTSTLKEFIGKKGDIIDPYYTNHATYRRVLKEIDKYIETLVRKIIKINNRERN